MMQRVKPDSIRSRLRTHGILGAGAPHSLTRHQPLSLRPLRRSCGANAGEAFGDVIL